MTRGQKNEFHAYKNPNVANVAMAGRARGTMILHRILERDALSSMAASSISLGIPTKNCRIRKVPYAVNANGMINAARLSSQPNCNMSWNNGMMSTTNGTMTDPR